MKVDLLFHDELKNLSLVADAGENIPGSTFKMMGASNELSIRSTGAVQDDKTLHVNDDEVVLSSTLKAYANGETNPSGVGLHVRDSVNVRIVGAGTAQSPSEAQIQLPAATESDVGIVKIVNEGSHGFPCPGISDRMTAGVYNPDTGLMLLLRNGADDLEKDVFISHIDVETGTYTATAERFRPPALPITAKPVCVLTSGPGTVLIYTTEGLYTLLTNESVDWRTWRAVKLNFAPNSLIPAPGSGGEYWRGRYTVLVGSKLYYVTSILNNSQMYVAIWEGAIGSGGTVDMVFKPLTGRNYNDTQQNGTPAFFLFDKMWGNPGEKCFAYNENGYWTYGVDTAHHGDDIDFVVEGNRLRVCHDGFNYAARPGRSLNHRHNLSYVIDLAAYTVIPDRIASYPLPFSQNGWPHAVHKPLLGYGGGNEEFTPVRSGGIALGLQSDNLAIVPYMHRAIAISGVSEFEMIKAGNNKYSVPWAKQACYGLYGGVVRMGWGAATPISDSVYIGINTDGVSSRVEVDPYGSYGPTIPGYGPTNNRTELNRSIYDTMKQMVSYYDGRSVQLNGAVLSDLRNESHSMLDMSGNPDQLVRVDAAKFNKFRDDVFARISHLYTNPRSVHLSIMVHRCDQLPCFGLLQFEHQDANNAQQMNATNYLFAFRPNRVIGTIDGFVFDRELKRKQTVSNTVSINYPGYASLVCSASLYRLEDGNYVATFTGMQEAYIGNSHATQAMVVWNTLANVPVYSDITPRYAYLRNGWTYCKEYGFGYGYQSPAGESFYFKAYGKTASTVSTSAANDANCQVYTLVMSRTDAGDNVTISQMAATKLRDKVHSIIPPARKVQNMDLSQDRTITKAMVANTNKIENIADMSYPTKTIHTDSLRNSALNTHTHQPSDFTFATATTQVRGGGRLGNIDDSDNIPASVTVLKDMSLSKLQTRPHVLTKLDVTMATDVEI